PSEGAAMLAMSAGSVGRRSSVPFSEQGAVVSESDEEDAVQVTVRAASFTLPNILEILARRVKHLQITVFSKWSFERNLLPYLRRAQKDPEVVAARDFRPALFGSHLYAHDTGVSDKDAPDDHAANRWLDSSKRRSSIRPQGARYLSPTLEPFLNKPE